MADPRFKYGDRVKVIPLAQRDGRIIGIYLDERIGREYDVRYLNHGDSVFEHEYDVRYFNHGELKCVKLFEDELTDG